MRNEKRVGSRSDPLGQVAGSCDRSFLTASKRDHHSEQGPIYQRHNRRSSHQSSVELSATPSARLAGNDHGIGGMEHGDQDVADGTMHVRADGTRHVGDYGVIPGLKRGERSRLRQICGNTPSSTDKAAGCQQEEPDSYDQSPSHRPTSFDTMGLMPRKVKLEPAEPPAPWPPALVREQLGVLHCMT